MDYSELSSERLVQLCLDTNDESAWFEFVRRFRRDIAVVVLRVARRWGENSRAIVDDLIQDTYLTLCAHDRKPLRRFISQRSDSLAAYLRVIAANVAHDFFRSRGTEKRGGQSKVSSMEPADLDMSAPSMGAEAIERQAQIGEILETLNQIPESEIGTRERTIFLLYYQQGFTAQAIADLRAFKLSTKGVESCLQRTVQVLRKMLGGRHPASMKNWLEGNPNFPTIESEKAE